MLTTGNGERRIRAFQKLIHFDTSTASPLKKRKQFSNLKVKNVQFVAAQIPAPKRDGESTTITRPEKFEVFSVIDVIFYSDISKMNSERLPLTIWRGTTNDFIRFGFSENYSGRSPGTNCHFRSSGVGEDLHGRGPAAAPQLRAEGTAHRRRPRAPPLPTTSGCPGTTSPRPTGTKWNGFLDPSTRPTNISSWR